MEVVAAGSTGVPPFHDHDVREWSRLDSLTGVLERAKLETDNWTANINNANHKYNKVVDSRARTDADGALQAEARRQLEVFHTQTPGGAQLQVIKTVTSSRSWSSTANGHTATTTSSAGKDFENLQLALNPLDLSTEKSKASVGRSASRRPPTRQRHQQQQQQTKSSPLETAEVNLHRVSRLCHQLHESAVKQAFGSARPLIEERQSGDGSVEICEIEDEETAAHNHNLQRHKSTSNEDLKADKDNGFVEDLEDLEQLQNWRRTSKIRRSLQFPTKSQQSKILDLPDRTGSVKKLREDLEKGRRLNTALRGNSIDLEALDQILQTISSSSSIVSDRTNEDNLEDDEVRLITKKDKKRDSFVTVESLAAVKGRLRRTNQEEDDGIVTEMQPQKSRVRSYVFGMEAMLNNKKPVLGTGSLESRSKLTNGAANNRTEDWYNRRKSYGFEKVHAHEESMNKSKVESSTDSGICRSTEIVVVPTIPNTNYSDSCSSSDSDSKSFMPVQNGNVRKMTSLFNNFKPKSTTITIPILGNNLADVTWNDEPERDIKRHSIAVDDTTKYGQKMDSKMRRTSLALNDHQFDDDGGQARKTKKVEFCKTEVHFAADSGKVNIVETDEKPPPTNNFRRRRRNSGPLQTEDYNRNGLPVLHFGDSSYEKSMFSAEDEDKLNDTIYENVHNRVPAFGIVTVNNNTSIDYQVDKKEQNEHIRGILKNKPIKPRPYHLGDVPFISDTEDDRKWGVNLRPVKKDEPPLWRSTVNVHNSVYKPEFQTLLKNLRPTGRRDSDSDSSELLENRKVEECNAKGYSTKVNFGNGEATVIENESETRAENCKVDAPVVNGLPPTASKTASVNLARHKFSPIVIRKAPIIRPDLKSAQPVEKLSSPSLVNRNVNGFDHKLKERQSPNRQLVNGRASPAKLPTTGRKSPVKSPVKDIKTGTKHDMVLRQPRKSEMTYFGVNVSPKVQRNTKLTEKPDLLQNHTTKPRLKSPVRNEPIYENVRNHNSPKPRQFDSAILDELTKAADEILQAVNGYTDEDVQTRLTSEDDSKKPQSRTKSAHVQSATKSANSTMDSTKKSVIKAATRTPPERLKKKVEGTTTSKSIAKARRLQRASSREALLQSHGSSSEDLSIAVEAPVRKPRLVKKTKAAQFTISNGLGMERKVKKKDCKPEDSRILNSLPEIRHKTAVSTIRSTADKTTSSSRHRTEEAKKKSPQKRDLVKGANSHGSRTDSRTKGKETIVTHRTSTATIKKCQRSEGGAATRH